MLTILPLFIQAGIFVTPVGYSLAGAPANIHLLLILNPVTGMIEAWRWAMLDMPHTHLGAIIISLVWSVVLLILGWRVFARLEVAFADFV